MKSFFKYGNCIILQRLKTQKNEAIYYNDPHVVFNKISSPN